MAPPLPLQLDVPGRDERWMLRPACAAVPSMSPVARTVSGELGGLQPAATCIWLAGAEACTYKRAVPCWLRHSYAVQGTVHLKSKQHSSVFIERHRTRKVDSRDGDALKSSEQDMMLSERVLSSSHCSTSSCSHETSMRGSARLPRLMRHRHHTTRCASAAVTRGGSGSKQPSADWREKSRPIKPGTSCASEMLCRPYAAPANAALPSTDVALTRRRQVPCQGVLQPVRPMRHVSPPRWILVWMLTWFCSCILLVHLVYVGAGTVSTVLVQVLYPPCWCRYYIHHVKDACAFLGPGMSRTEQLEEQVHGRKR